MENTKQQLKKFRVDSIYEKKKHYNAAQRKLKYYNWISIGQIVLNAITGTALINAVFGQGNKVSEIIALVFTVLATIFASLQKIWAFEKQSQGHMSVGNMYLGIGKFINITLAQMDDGILSEEDVKDRIEQVLENLNNAYEIGSQFATNSVDYKLAQQGINNGEENYTEKELNLWE